MNTDFVEKDCSIELGGKTFTEGGAYVLGDRALVYITADNAERRGYRVTDWHGNALGELLEIHIGAKRWSSHGYWRMAYVKVRLDGRTWTGRYNIDNSQCVRLRATKA